MSLLTILFEGSAKRLSPAVGKYIADARAAVAVKDCQILFVEDLWLRAPLLDEAVLADFLCGVGEPVGHTPRLMANTSDAVELTQLFSENDGGWSR